jgi:hypothetical protein
VPELPLCPVLLDTTPALLTEAEDGPQLLATSIVIK